MKKRAVLVIIAAIMNNCAWASKATVENKTDRKAVVFYTLEYDRGSYTPSTMDVKSGQVGIIDTTKTTDPTDPAFAAMQGRPVLSVQVPQEVEVEVYEGDDSPGARMKGLRRGHQIDLRRGISEEEIKELRNRNKIGKSSVMRDTEIARISFDNTNDTSWEITGSGTTFKL